jgi:hypothetical protein
MESLHDWTRLATYIFVSHQTCFIITRHSNLYRLNPGHYAATPSSYLAASIHTLLLSTLLQPSAVLLALWYIVQLPVYFNALSLGEELVKEKVFGVALLGDADIGLDHETLESNTPFRLVVLGCMLANKWLDDHTFSNKPWYVYPPHHFCQSVDIFNQALHFERFYSHMMISNHRLVDDNGPRWMESAQHYPYAGPALIPVPIVGMQPAW